MRCRVSRLTLTAYLDEELGVVRYHLVRFHLRRCERCRSRLSQLKAADALVHLSRESSGPTRGMSGRLPGRLQVELGLGPIHEPAPPTPGRRWRVRIAAAVVLALLVGAGVLAVSWPAREAGDLLALGMENQAKATALLAECPAGGVRNPAAQDAASGGQPGTGHPERAGGTAHETGGTGGVHQGRRPALHAGACRGHGRGRKGTVTPCGGSA